VSGVRWILELGNSEWALIGDPAGAMDDGVTLEAPFWSKSVWLAEQRAVTIWATAQEAEGRMTVPWDAVVRCRTVDMPDKESS
jgi:hypothetical protein